VLRPASEAIDGRRWPSVSADRDAARLIGSPEEYELPNDYNEAYHLAGDGDAVPVGSFLATHIFEPNLASAFAGQKAA